MKKKRLILLCVKLFASVLASVTVLGLISPIYFIIIRAFSPTKDMYPMTVFPNGFTLANFSELFDGTGEDGLPFSRNLFSAVAVAVTTAAVQIPVVISAAYVLAKVRAPGIRLLNRVIEWSVILTPLALYVPQYFLMLKTGISDSFFAMILPFIASPLSVYLVKKYMSVISDDMVYAARLEGASHFRICFDIVLPNIKPAVFALLTMSLGNMWSYTGELFVYSASLKPLGSLLQKFSWGEENVGVFCAVGAVIVSVMAVLAAVFNKDISKTAALAGIKSERCKKADAEKRDEDAAKTKTEGK